MKKGDLILTTFEMLPDKTYSYRDEYHLYDLFNITNRLPHNKP